MPSFRDYSLNFKYDKTSDFIESQLPAFVKMEGADFVEFIKSYYRFLESKIVEVVISSDNVLIGNLAVGDIVSSVNCIICEDGITYLGDGNENAVWPLMELDGYRKNLIQITNFNGNFIPGEGVIGKYANGELTGATANVIVWDESTSTLQLENIEHEFLYGNLIYGNLSHANGEILVEDSVIRPISVYGTSLGSIDLDNVSVSTEVLPRKKIIINHLSGSIERLNETKDFGELFSKTIFESLKNPTYNIENIQHDTIDTVTVITNDSHSFIIGDKITIKNSANDSIYEGSYLISNVIDDTTFRFILPYFEVGNTQPSLPLYFSIEKETSSTILSKIFNFTEVETPINAMNNMFNYGDIDYSFNNQLFLGVDYYSMMANEIMSEWPKVLVSPTEETVKAVIGRNIKDFYYSKGTEDSIKFLFRIIYGKEAQVFLPADRLFSCNDGRWSINYSIKVNTDLSDEVLLSNNRIIHNTANTGYYAFVESTKEESAILDITVIGSDNLDFDLYEIVTSNIGATATVSSWDNITNKLSIKPLTGSIHINDTITGSNSSCNANVTSKSGITSLILSNAFGDFVFGESIVGSTLSGAEFTCDIVESMIQIESYASNRGLLNGGIQAPIPTGYDTWDDPNLASQALDVANSNVTDRIQDGDYWQLFSYVIRTNLSSTEFESAKSNIQKLVHPAGFKLFLEPL